MTAQEADAVKIASHRNKERGALLCFLAVKSSLIVVSQMALSSRALWLGAPVASSVLSGAEGALLAPVPGTALPHWPWPCVGAQ